MIISSLLTAVACHIYWIEFYTLYRILRKVHLLTMALQVCLQQSVKKSLILRFYELLLLTVTSILSDINATGETFANYADPHPGATRMARGGIRLVHGHTKSTLITYFLGMKIDPKYAFLHAIFLICPSCPIQNLSIWPILHVFGERLRSFVAGFGLVTDDAGVFCRTQVNHVTTWLHDHPKYIGWVQICCKRYKI